MDAKYTELPMDLSNMIEDYAINLRDYAVKIPQTYQEDYEQPHPYIRQDYNIEGDRVWDHINNVYSVDVKAGVENRKVRQCITNEFFRQYFLGYTGPVQPHLNILSNYLKRKYKGHTRTYNFTILYTNIELPLELYHDLRTWIVEDYPSAFNPTTITLKTSNEHGMEVDRPYSGDLDVIPRRPL